MRKTRSNQLIITADLVCRLAEITERRLIVSFHDTTSFKMHLNMQF